jgi:O-succinylbenzoic acid--CoA ligase
MHVLFETEDLTIKNDVNTFINEWHEVNPVMEVQTSGSTGTPKTIVISKKHMEASAKMTGAFLGLEKGDTALLCLSPQTIAGKMMLVRALVLELKLIVSNVSSSPISENKAEFDFAAMVPMQVKNTIEKGTLNRIKKLIVGGGTIAEELWQDIAKADIDAYQTFGMTETISHIAMRIISHQKQPYSAMPNVHFGVSDGCLVVNAPELGVHDLETNDVIRWIDKTQFEWLGRKDLVINSGGVKIHPERIEDAIHELFHTPFFATGLQDDVLGERHVLCVEGLASNSIIRADIEQFLHKHSVPKDIYYFATFVYTESGKIDRINTLKKITDAEKQVL